MKINWKIRLSNPVFWYTVTPALIAFLYNFLSVFGVVPGVSEETLINLTASLFALMSALGVVVDPTTQGCSDSERALGYEKLM